MNSDVEARLRRIEILLSMFEQKLRDIEQRLERSVTMLAMARNSIPASG